MIPKFRAWHKGLKRMFSVSQIRWHCETQDKLEYVCFYEIGCDNEVDEIELMQWTTLQDKNKKDIYINDIVRVHGHIYFDGEDCQFYDGVVCYVEELGKLMFYSPQNEYSEDYDDFMVNSMGGQLEILGNIFEHPELLENK